MAMARIWCGFVLVAMACMLGPVDAFGARVEVNMERHARQYGEVASAPESTPQISSFVVVDGVEIPITTEKSSTSFPMWTLVFIIGGPLLLLLCLILLIILVLIVALVAMKNRNEGSGGESGSTDKWEVTAPEGDVDYRTKRGGAALGGADTAMDTGLGEFKAPLSLTPERDGEGEVEEEDTGRRKHPILKSSSSSVCDYRDDV